MVATHNEASITHAAGALLSGAATVPPRQALSTATVIPPTPHTPTHTLLPLQCGARASSMGWLTTPWSGLQP